MVGSLGNRTDGAGVHFQSKHIKINIQKDFFLCARLLMLDIFFSKAQIKPVLYLCASGKKKRKEKRCVSSAGASPLLAHFCSNAKRSLCFQKGVLKVFFHRAETSSGEKRNRKSKGKSLAARRVVLPG